jgi:hypothetical protein
MPLQTSDACQPVGAVEIVSEFDVRCILVLPPVSPLSGRDAQCGTKNTAYGGKMSHDDEECNPPFGRVPNPRSTEYKRKGLTGDRLEAPSFEHSEQSLGDTNAFKHKHMYGNTSRVK